MVAVVLPDDVLCLRAFRSLVGCSFSIRGRGRLVLLFVHCSVYRAAFAVMPWAVGGYMRCCCTLLRYGRDCWAGGRCVQRRCLSFTAVLLRGDVVLVHRWC